MLPVLRLLSLFLGGVTLSCALAIPMIGPWFKGPGIAVSAALLLAALAPGGIAPRALRSMHGFALGVFAVALTGYLGPNAPIVPLLAGGMAINLAGIVLLRGATHPVARAFG